MEVLWKSRNQVLLDLLENNKYNIAVKCLTMLYLHVVEDIPNVGKTTGVENPALYGSFYPEITNSYAIKWAILNLMVL